MSFAFNETFYLANNPDVAEAVAAGTVASAEEHYNLFGWSEGRDPNEHFDTSFYLSENPDVAAAGVNPFHHFLTYGAAEGRVPNPTIDALLVRLAKATMSLIRQPILPPIPMCRPL